jgi:hypothetical protein
MDNEEAGLGARCVALAQAALSELQAGGWRKGATPVLAWAPPQAVASLAKALPALEMQAAASSLLTESFQRLLQSPEVEGVVLLAVDAPRALLDAAPTRFNPATQLEEPDLDLPLRGEAGQAAVALYLTRAELEHELPAQAWLHRHAEAEATLAETLDVAAVNGRLSQASLLVHTAGTDKVGGTRLAKLAMNLPAFEAELDVVDNALNVPREEADYGGASFWVGVARAVAHVEDEANAVLCVDCQSETHMLALAINPPTVTGEV